MFIPKIEKITRDITASHFLLMFGYKLFSIYYPLFLIERGFSLSEVGYTYLLIYLPIALFAPIVGFLNHRINPATLATLGIFGYGVYALGMILIHNPFLFYFWQVLLGISAALFFVSMRAVLISSPLENYDRAFSWFYTAPYYADAFAPIIGALFIWKFGFIGVFILSLVLQFLNAIFCFTRLGKQKIRALNKSFNFETIKLNYQKVFEKIKDKATLIPIFISLSVLLLVGFYSAFFVLFLKNLNWSQNQILIFGSLLSLLFLPISLFVISRVAKQKSEKNISRGVSITGFFSILVGSLVSILNFPLMLLMILGKSAGNLMTDAGRSGLISRKLEKYPEEAGTIDTIFTPLGTALGAFISGLLIASLGFPGLFLIGGIFAFLVGILGFRICKGR